MYHGNTHQRVPVDDSMPTMSQNEGYGPQDESSTWYSNIVKVGCLCSTHCSVSSNDCQVLVTTLKQAREQCKQMKKRGRTRRSKMMIWMASNQLSPSRLLLLAIVSPPVVFKHAVMELPTEPTEHLPKKLHTLTPTKWSNTKVSNNLPHLHKDRQVPCHG
jgi:hypothetical protein